MAFFTISYNSLNVLNKDQNIDEEEILSMEKHIEQKYSGKGDDEFYSLGFVNTPQEHFLTVVNIIDNFCRARGIFANISCALCEPRDYGIGVNEGYKINVIVGDRDALERYIEKASDDIRKSYIRK